MMRPIRLLTPQRRTLPWIFVWGTVFAATLLAYAPGLSGGFMFDDYASIIRNPDLRIDTLDIAQLKQAALSSHTGPLKRPVSLLSFALNYYATALDPFYFKLTNVIIHLLNGLGLACLTYLILLALKRLSPTELSTSRIAAITLAVTAAWLLHPLNLTAVLYIVQRMTSLAALFVIWGLVLYALGRLRMQAGSGGPLLVVAGLVPFTVLAVFSKENGVLLPVYAFLMELALFRFRRSDGTRDRRILGIFFVTLALPVLAAMLFLLSHPNFILHGYATRTFTLPERLLTEPRVLFFYLRMIFLPENSALGLFHDDFALSHGWLSPVTTLPAAIGLVTLLTAGIILLKRHPLAGLGILWFFASHAIESTIFPLELVHEHRNYLAIYGPLLVAFYYALRPYRKAHYARLRTIAALAMLALFGVTTALRADQFGNEFSRTLYAVRHHPLSSRSNFAAGRMYTITLRQQPSDRHEAYYLTARHYLQESYRLDSQSSAALFTLIYLNATTGHELDSPALRELEHRLMYAPFAPANRSWLALLVDWQVAGNTNLSTNQFLGLLEASLHNDSMPAMDRGFVLTLISGYYSNHLRDATAALDYARRATVAAPSQPLFHVNFARVLIVAGNLKRAEEQIQLAAVNDPLHTATRAIDGTREMLARARNISTDTPATVDRR